MCLDFITLFDQEFQDTISSARAGVLSVWFVSIRFVSRTIPPHSCKSVVVGWIHKMVSLLASGGFQPGVERVLSSMVIEDATPRKGSDWFLPALVIRDRSPPPHHPQRKLFWKPVLTMWRLSHSLVFGKRCFEVLPYVGPCAAVLTAGERGRGTALLSPLRAV